MDYSILVGGAAGQGIDTFSKLLDKTLKRCGFYVFTNNDFMSRVRGGHNFTQIRFSDEPIYSHSSKVDIIFALNEETVSSHNGRLKEGGIVIADIEVAKEEDIIHLPLTYRAKELKNTKVYPTVGLGAILKYLGLPIDIAKEVIRDKLNEKVTDINIKALELGYELTEVKYNLKVFKDENILIDGNEAVALGAIAAGCKFYCGYPMTPSTGVLSYIASKSEKMGIAVDQVEDEVAALNMALGASYAGVRAMTGSSGGGFSLMVEALSLAGIIETPVVVINVQRPGPATGLPTRTEQSDLRFLIHAGHGEFPRMVIALRNVEDAFYQTAKAFNTAEKYQIPVLLMSDQYFSDSMSTIKPFDFKKVTIERHIASENDIGEGEYKRYKYSESGISPRLIPGQIKNQVVLVDSDEHDEYGNITEDDEVRKNMVDKRMRKLEGLKKELLEPWVIGQEKAENLIVCWGSTYGAVKEAVERLEKEGVSIGALVYGDIWPFPTKKLLEGRKYASKIIDIEQNATAQLDSLIREEALFKCTHKILKYDGRAFSGDEIYHRLKEEVL
ncbi:2-oxoacid:acceptor oxidoreductase subunit alpha [Clostridium sp. MSJ-11]|uniref:2-oxoacid:acceptor oxidoreductase subunit alpha n=1 Tax=Clostridium mobile TaxID=2841512 RepID=A0ABS6EI21_9CLOT|nr:2-oxoacid:acceptor oxidoreductase subunit alpha [Clostridium mobile]MBU5484640.1 2-oxoacid:acceptor oxidoreductase subunit alpha [Clostridium mobile]